MCTHYATSTSFCKRDFIGSAAHSWVPDTAAPLQGLVKALLAAKGGATQYQAGGRAMPDGCILLCAVHNC